jgi:hypothetical protein
VALVEVTRIFSKGFAGISSAEGAHDESMHTYRFALWRREYHQQQF